MSKNKMLFKFFNPIINPINLIINPIIRLWKTPKKQLFFYPHKFVT